MSQLEISKTALAGVLIIGKQRMHDDRGYLFELFRAQTYEAELNARPFVQDNVLRSRQGVVRGLHLQHPNAQGKLVTVTRGCIVDVAVDVRRGSPTFGKSVSVEISDKNGYQLWIPRGFAHGFSALSEDADVIYKSDDYYDPTTQIAINCLDPALGIDWRVAKPIVSPRDAAAPRLADVSDLPAYQHEQSSGRRGHADRRSS
jgi:dTDP-4-dehydrorhamnose 3,5-epimerase